jgi:hypothetical protein
MIVRVICEANPLNTSFKTEWGCTCRFFTIHRLLCVHLFSLAIFGPMKDQKHDIIKESIAKQWLVGSLEEQCTKRV